MTQSLVESRLQNDIVTVDVTTSLDLWRSEVQKPTTRLHSTVIWECSTLTAPGDCLQNVHL